MRIYALRHILRVGLKSIAVHRLRSTLTILGIVLGVASVIVMLMFIKTIDGFHIIAGLIILLREITVSGLREFLASLQISVPVSQLAKWKATFQMVALGALAGLWVFRRELARARLPFPGSRASKVEPPRQTSQANQGPEDITDQDRVRFGLIPDQREHQQRGEQKEPDEPSRDLAPVLLAKL